MATADTVIRSRIDLRSKEEAAAVFAEMGLTMSDGIRLFLRRVAQTHSIPFELRTPNAASRRAITQAKAIKERYSSIEEMMGDLDGEGQLKQKSKRTAGVR